VVTGSVGVSHSKTGTAYTIRFATPLNATSATNTSLYQVLEGVTKVVKKHKQTLYTKALKIKSVVYTPGPNTVTIMLAKPSKGTVKVVIAPGLDGADGAATGSSIPLIAP
jgi:hypothetical protein